MSHGDVEQGEKEAEGEEEAALHVGQFLFHGLGGRLCGLLCSGWGGGEGGTVACGGDRGNDGFGGVYPLLNIRRHTQILTMKFLQSSMPW